MSPVACHAEPLLPKVPTVLVLSAQHAYSMEICAKDSCAQFDRSKNRTLSDWRRAARQAWLDHDRTRCKKARL